MAQTTVQNARIVGSALERESKMGVTTKTLAAAGSLGVNDNTCQFIDAGGTTRVVTLPAEASSVGLFYLIVNTGGEDLTIKEDSGTTTIVTISTTECGMVVCDGTDWKGFIGATT